MAPLLLTTFFALSTCVQRSIVPGLLFTWCVRAVPDLLQVADSYAAHMIAISISGRVKTLLRARKR